MAYDQIADAKEMILWEDLLEHLRLKPDEHPLDQYLRSVNADITWEDADVVRWLDSLARAGGHRQVDLASSQLVRRLAILRRRLLDRRPAFLKYRTQILQEGLDVPVQRRADLAEQALAEIDGEEGDAMRSQHYLPLLRYEQRRHDDLQASEEQWP